MSTLERCDERERGRTIAYDDELSPDLQRTRQGESALLLRDETGLRRKERDVREIASWTWLSVWVCSRRGALVYGWSKRSLYERLNRREWYGSRVSPIESRQDSQSLNQSNLLLFDVESKSQQRQTKQTKKKQKQARHAEGDGRK